VGGGGVWGGIQKEKEDEITIMGIETVGGLTQSDPPPARKIKKGNLSEETLKILQIKACVKRGSRGEEKGSLPIPRQVKMKLEKKRRRPISETGRQRPATVPSDGEQESGQANA